MQMRAASEAVYQFWNVQWAGTTPTAYPAIPIDEPAAPWARISTRPNSSIQLTTGSIGNRLFEHRESCLVQIFTVSDSGEGQLLDLSDQARKLFQGAAINIAGEDVHFFQVDARRAPDEPHLISMIVEAQYRYQARQ